MIITINYSGLGAGEPNITNDVGILATGRTQSGGRGHPNCTKFHCITIKKMKLSEKLGEKIHQ